MNHLGHGCRVALLVLLVGAEASAQSRAIDAHFFRPALYSRGIFALDRAGWAPKWQPGFKVFFNHAATPLKLTFPMTGTCPGARCAGQHEIIQSAQVLNLQAQFGITRWLELGIDLPVIHQSYVTGSAAEPPRGFGLLTASDPKSSIAPATVTTLDMRFGLRANLVGARGFGVSLAVDGSAPLGDKEVFASNGSFSVHPRLLASFDRGPFSIAANVGGRFREKSLVLWDDSDTKEEGELPLLGLGHELTVGIGAAYAVHPVFGLGVEFYGAAPLALGRYEVTSRRLELDSTKCPAGSAPGVPCEIVTSRQLKVPGRFVSEVLGGIFVTPIEGLTIAAGAGPGVSGTERQVSFRVFGGISWMPGAEAVAGDRDKDGIPDDKDRCPDQPEDKDGFQDDDGCPDPDNDGDGVPDEKDGCPDQAEDKDGFQDDDGCPDPDNDGDKIADKDDKCPNEPETVNGYQDEDGCPDSVPTGVAVGKTAISIPEQIGFARGTAVIAESSHAILDAVAKKIVASPQLGQIRIEGHCDDTGKPQKNLTLSQARADAVMSYLVKRGVPAGRLQAVGYGAKRPLVPNTTEENRAKNRRVEFIIIKAKEGTP